LEHPFLSFTHTVTPFIVRGTPCRCWILRTKSKSQAAARHLLVNRPGSGDDEIEFKIEQTTDGLDRMRSTYEEDFDGNKSTRVLVIDGDKGWSKEGEMEVMEMEEEELADEKHGIYSQSMALTLVPLKGKDPKFQTEAVGDEKVGDKPAAGVKVTPPVGKDFTIYFDKESGLPVKVVAVMSDPESIGQEFTQESYFSDFKDFGGIKQAKKIEMKRDGETFIKLELLDFKILDKVEDKTFAKPAPKAKKKAPARKAKKPPKGG
ncbi:MAG TPA: hypothetical protein VND64_04815, partial [Pirellulales bacterium]|nr:hypothetical protein [Pirellulales bacterium]